MVATERVIKVYPLLRIDVAKLRHNAQTLVDLAKSFSISIWGVTKVLGGAPPVGAAMLAGGVTALADSRLTNLRRLASSFPDTPKVLLRLPSPRQAEAVVHIAACSLNSEWTTLQALSQAAVAAQRQHRVLLMVDVGDLREGLWPDQVIPFVKRAIGLPGLQIAGLGTNLTCYGGVIPSPKNLGILVDLARELERQGLVQCEIVSGGNSSSLQLLQEGKIPRGINNLRLGESLILGRETVSRHPIAGLHTDAVVLQAEVVEVKQKPSVPVGHIGQDAFGNKPVFVDRGLQRRAIVAIGKQDVDPGGLAPLDPGITVLGASSDHLLLDVGAYPGKVKVGQVFSFGLNYAALLAASTSAYVHKVYKNYEE